MEDTITYNETKTEVTETTKTLTLEDVIKLVVNKVKDKVDVKPHRPKLSLFNLLVIHFFKQRWLRRSFLFVLAPLYIIAVRLWSQVILSNLSASGTVALSPPLISAPNKFTPHSQIGLYAICCIKIMMDLSRYCP